eukprot:COSAG04_NODE_9565_length_851_cov_1.304521_3_plen_22_part_01
MNRRRWCVRVAFDEDIRREAGV